MTTNTFPKVNSFDDFLSVEISPANRFIFYISPPSKAFGLGRRWIGQEFRLDDQGRQWTRFIDRLVVDDFGALVEVPQ
ncbi:MAG: hypothetical protein Q7J58_17540 [Hydrogenophaga sp.]|uniref:hypothetical protein n=1 Tax=Hydrogenophaga sp. TaxID=1904254 RepID=UPI002719ACCF|nr:hypothetical protein [Hydrogenophaga sp.]MDO9571156.1 hypothetical protein [Hydrogenophaga sp.]MDP3372972.1 hypothetical protein [Hydrogenophaga sp.]